MVTLDCPLCILTTIWPTMLSNSSKPWAHLWSPEGVPLDNAGDSKLNVLHEYRAYFLQTLFTRTKKRKKEKQANWDRGRNPVGH